jgi:hypothetical protein
MRPERSNWRFLRTRWLLARSTRIMRSMRVQSNPDNPEVKRLQAFNPEVRVGTVALVVFAAIAGYVLAWHLVLAVILGMGSTAGRSAHELRDAYLQDFTQLFRVGGSELTDFVQRVALGITALELFVAVMIWAIRQKRNAR